MASPDNQGSHQAVQVDSQTQTGDALVVAVGMEATVARVQGAPAAFRWECFGRAEHRTPT
jgi:hypothetical protein